MFRSLDISTSGLVAQRQRLNTIAGNIANVDTTRGPDGKPALFHRRLVTFQADTASPGSVPTGVGVLSKVEIDTKSPPRMVHQPGHPDADAKGNVSLPNVNLLSEFTDATLASRAYEANLAAIEMSKSIANASLRILS
jgi:flagellar basal-body rod protein FlgC